MVNLEYVLRVEEWSHAMVRRSVSLAVCLGFGFSTLPNKADAQASTALVSSMTRELEQEGLVGAVWSTVHPVRGVSTGAAGRRHANYPALLAPGDRVQVGSVAKTLIATGILRLVTEGKLQLDMPVSQLLPSIVIRNEWDAARPVRLRHLLDHTSGLDDARLWQLFNSEVQSTTPLSDGLDNARLRLQVRQPPGDRFSYSNTGYGLLGLVIEAVTGIRYESYLDQNLLRPLGMTNSTFEFVTQQGAGADSSFAMGHFENGALAPAVPSYLRPAMQFTTTAADMARLAQFLMGNGLRDGVPFIDHALLRAMGSPVDTEASRSGLRIGYALGLMSRDRMGTIGKCHAGNTVGYRAMFCIYPEQGKAFFVSMNADNEDARYGRLDSLVISTLELERLPIVAAPESEAIPPAWNGIYVLRPARFEMFRYLDLVVDFIRVRTGGSQLVLAPFQGDPVRLERVDTTLFRAPGRTQASHVLLQVSPSNFAISDGMRTWERVSLWRMTAIWSSLAVGLVGFLFIVLRGAYLALRRRLAPANAMFPPALIVVALIAALALLSQQSVLALGDRSATNVLLAVVTGLVPVAMVAGLWQVIHRGRPRGIHMIEALAFAGVLQWSLVLGAYGLVPVRLWG
jgi:CubicO group peptidase (beta-lactamase class C family)